MTLSARDEWIISRAAPTLEDLKHTSQKCHLDEAITLCNYLNGEVDAEYAARAFTTIVELQNNRIPDPTVRPILQGLRRIMRLLTETLMYFDQDCELIMDLLVAIQSVPPTPKLHWWRLPSFSKLWQDCYIIFRNRDPCSIDFYKKAGSLEAKMYLYDLYPVDSDWAYRAINLICLEQPDLECTIHEILPWLDIAGSKLAENLQPCQNKAFERAMRGRRDKTYMIEVTMYEHWEHWKKRFVQIRHDDEFLSSEARAISGKCYEIMRKYTIEPPSHLEGKQY